MQQKVYACLCVCVSNIWRSAKWSKALGTKELNDVFEIGLHFHEEWIIPLFNYVGCLIYSTKLHESLHLVCVNVFYARKRTTRVGKSEYGKIIIITKYIESTFVVVNTSILNLSLPPSSSSCFYLFCSFLPYLTMHNILYSPFCVHWL